MRGPEAHVFYRPVFRSRLCRPRATVGWGSLDTPKTFCRREDWGSKEELVQLGYRLTPHRNVGIGYCKTFVSYLSLVRF